LAIEQKNELSKRYSQQIEINGTIYPTFDFNPDYVVQNTEIGILPLLFQIIHKNFVVFIGNVPQNATFIDNTNNIYGDNNDIHIEQNNINNIIYNIEKVINADILSESDTDMLELFKYRLSAKQPLPQNASEIIEMLNGYIPHATFVIELINLLNSLLQ
jgi:hypothetical protein